jgi:PTS system nitrogen regulatory IIA component
MNISVKEAALLLSVSEKTIYRWIKQDILPAYKVHENYRFNRTELLEWATSQRKGVALEAFTEPASEAESLPSLYEALEAGGVFYRIEGDSREEVLASAVMHLRLPEETNRHYLEQMLVTREKLASTAINNGIAIPHPRSPGLVNVLRPTVTLFFLEHLVDFNALDGQPVSILMPIISPNLSSHLHLLSRLAFVLRDPEFVQVLSSEACREKIFAALSLAEKKIKA